MDEIIHWKTILTLELKLRIGLKKNSIKKWTIAYLEGQWWMSETLLTLLTWIDWTTFKQLNKLNNVVVLITFKERNEIFLCANIKHCLS